MMGGKRAAGERQEGRGFTKREMIVRWAENADKFCFETRACGGHQHVRQNTRRLPQPPLVLPKSEREGGGKGPDENDKMKVVRRNRRKKGA